MKKVAIIVLDSVGIGALPDAAKWLSTVYMLIGRLELFTVLLLLSPVFWKKR